MDTLLHDLRYGLRTLLRTPAFTVAATLCLALGIGANTAIFSVINAVLLRPLPYSDPERLVMVWEAHADRTNDQNVVSPANFLDWKRQSTVFEDMAAVVAWRTNLTGDGEPEELPLEYATASFFSVLGVQPALGRVYTVEEDAPRAQGVAVLSHELWQRRFGGDRATIGRKVTLNGNPVTIIGIMPRGFQLEGGKAELWMPIGLDPATNYRQTTGRYLRAVARLKPGVSVARAQMEMRTIAARLSQTYTDFNAGWGVNVFPLHEQVVGEVRRTLLVLGGVVGFVLLIACANVANLQLARAAAREREIAVRAALGAGRTRVVRQLLTESVLLALIGGAVGLVLSAWGTSLLAAAAPDSLPRVREIGIDGRALVFTTVLSLVTGLLFGLVPALTAAKDNLHETLKEGSRGATGTRRARQVLVLSQVALSLVLLVGAGLMMRSFVRLQAVDPGFNPQNVLTVRIDLPGTKYRTPESWVAFFDQLLPRVRSIPGVTAAGAVNWLPFTGLASNSNYWIEGQPIPPPGEDFSAEIRSVEHGYFKAMQIGVVRGEPFTERETRDVRRAVVVNESLVRQRFPGIDPIGRHIMMPWGDTLRGEIVAVVKDVKHLGLDSLARPTLYWALPQFPYDFMTLVIRTVADPMSVVPALRAEVHALDPAQPLADVRPLEEYLGQSVARRQFNMTLLGLFASLALILAAIGIYGVLAYTVAQRTREIGVRIALGARQRSVQALIVRQGMRVVAGGIALGVLGALALTRVLRGLLFDVSATDPLTFLGVATVLGAVALLATYLPARRASQVDPMVALRNE